MTTMTRSGLLLLCSVTACGLISTSTVTAAPPSDTSLRGSGFTARRVGDSVVTTLTHATFRLMRDSFVIDDPSAPSRSYPLAETVGARVIPLVPSLSTDNRTLTLTPDRNPAHARPVADPGSMMSKLLASPKVLELGGAVGAGFTIGKIVGAGVAIAIGVLIVLAVVVPGCATFVACLPALFAALACVAVAAPIVGFLGAFAGVVIALAVVGPVDIPPLLEILRGQ